MNATYRMKQVSMNGSDVRVQLTWTLQRISAPARGMTSRSAIRPWHEDVS